jgi:hypothetical protein
MINDLADGDVLVYPTGPDLEFAPPTPYSHLGILPLDATFPGSGDLVCHCGRHHLPPGFIFRWITRQIARLVEWLMIQNSHIGINGETTCGIL